MTKDISILQDQAIGLLKRLIATPSFSKEEDNSSMLIKNFLENNGIKTEQDLYNIWAKNKHFDKGKPTILLNSHHDTVRPNKGYTMDPFSPVEEDGKLFGLGSNDAGGIGLIYNSSCYAFREGHGAISFKYGTAASSRRRSSENVRRGPRLTQSSGASSRRAVAQAS